MIDEEEESLQRTKCRYEDFCRNLNMDEAASSEAWGSFERISKNYTLEGSELHWLSCALYVACRKAVPTVSKGTVEGNYVSLTRILRFSEQSLIEFFSKMRKWEDMAGLSQEFRQRTEKLERDFTVSAALYKKYLPIFQDVFRDSQEDPPRQQRSRKQRRQPCTVSELFNFCWILFVHAKGNFPMISDDLVNSYHLLLCALDLVYGTTLLCTNRKDLLNPSFKGLPEDLHSKDYKAPSEAVCIIEQLCSLHDGLVLEAKGIKEHFWKPFIKKLFNKKILKGKEENLSGFLDPGNFGDSLDLQSLKQEMENAATEQQMNLTQELLLEKGHQSAVVGSTEMICSCGKVQVKDSGRKALWSVGFPGCWLNPMHSALEKAFRKQEPLESWIGYRLNQTCSRDPSQSIAVRLKEMFEVFCQHYSTSSEEYSGLSKDIAVKRFRLAEVLYYKILEGVINQEKKRLGDTDLSGILEQDVFHRSLLACCLEIVIFSYRPPGDFPWVIEIFDLPPYHFYKVIEVLIRTEDGLIREVVKHLNQVEEQVLESMAWRQDSPLWESVRGVKNRVPACEEVMPSQHFESPEGPGTTSSPLTPSRVNESRTDCAGKANENGGITFIPVQVSVSGQPQPLSAQTLAGTLNTQQITGSTLQVAGQVALSAGQQQKKSQQSPASTKPRRTGSLSLFFRKVYHLASVRLRDLCVKLDISDHLRRKIWTCFEFSLVHCTELMVDRHLDQLLMCAIYVMTKVTKEDKSFQNIMKCYRTQPQANSSVYRSVLIKGRRRRNSGSSDGSVRQNSPSGASKDKTSRDSSPVLMRSSSTLPVPQPSSSPPTPTRLTGANSDIEEEERGDLIQFYNSIYIKEIREFALRYSPNGNVTAGQVEVPPLSPYPSLRTGSPRRVLLSQHHSVYISPHKNRGSLSPRDKIFYYFSSSPSKVRSQSVALLETRGQASL
ncbi:UNVERIFIED_CONTAM: hypothetical protein FKN15_045771 [Acipenser sinensis]